MKKITLITMILLVAIIEGKSQDLEAGFGLGTGSAFMIENFDNGVDINYSMPFTAYSDFKYSKTDSYFGFKLKFQYLNAGITGSDWKNNNNSIDGDVTSFTSMLLLEHIESSKKWNIGYNFGLGHTYQELIESLVYSSTPIEKNYLSFNLSGIISYKTSEKLSIVMEPSLLWTDPARSFRNPDKWSIAGEDLSLLVQFGIKYKIN